MLQGNPQMITEEGWSLEHNQYNCFIKETLESYFPVPYGSTLAKGSIFDAEQGSPETKPDQ